MRFSPVSLSCHPPATTPSEGAPCIFVCENCNLLNSKTFWLYCFCCYVGNTRRGYKNNTLGHFQGMPLCSELEKSEIWRWKRSLITMSLWQSETLTVTNSNLMLVNRGFSINWQNEAHQSLRGEWCRDSVLSEDPAVTRVSGTNTLSLSLLLATCGSQQTSLQLILTAFVFPCRISNVDWMAFSASQGRDRIVKTHSWILAF